jgi:hypothetical protein
LTEAGAELLVQEVYLSGVLHSAFKKQEKDHIMKLLILAAAATLALTGGAMASEHGKHAKHVHYRDANASADTGAYVADGSIAGYGSHEFYLKNLRDSGYNPSNDRDVYGNERVN